MTGQPFQQNVPPPPLPGPPTFTSKPNIPPSQKKQSRKVVLIIIGSVLGLLFLCVMFSLLISKTSPNEQTIQTAIAKTNLALPSSTSTPSITMTHTPTNTATSTPTITNTPIPPEQLTATAVEATKQKAYSQATETRIAFVIQQTMTKEALYFQQTATKDAIDTQKTATTVAQESSYIDKAYVFMVDYADFLQLLSSGFSLAGDNPYYFMDSSWVLEMKGYLRDLTNTAYKLSTISQVPQKFQTLDILFNQIYLETQGMEYDIALGMDNLNVDAINRGSEHMNKINDLINQGTDEINSYK